MARGTLNAAGLTVLVIGVLFFFAGAAAAIVGFVTQNQEGDGFFGGGGENGTASDLQVFGIAGAILGVILAAVGAVMKGKGTPRAH